MVMNQDLQDERNKGTFNVERLTNLMDDGADRTARRRFIEDVIRRDPTGIFDNSENIYLHRTQRHVRALAKHVRMVEICRQLGIYDKKTGDITQSSDFSMVLKAVGDELPTALHWIMFVPNILTLCDEEQQARWLPLCRDWKMIGCYAQTELGHGSNVRALETTATFLPESKGGQPGGSWVVNSPTLTSTKFWPGTLGRTANHAMLIARLIDGQGVDRGIHNFLVPLRRMDNHKLLPGVVTGDIGPKIGYNNMDNGFARFDNVKIPRRNMAMRFATVDEKGVYSKKAVSKATSKVAYVTMMQVRALIVEEAGKALAVATTIVTRYSAVRRQGFASIGGEMQVLDYKQQQNRIFPLLACCYCFYFTGKKTRDRLSDIEQRLRLAQQVSQAEVADIHASTSSLKSFTTTVAADGIEECRKACGGHGYLMCSGLPELYTSYLQNPTVEGDNHMLPQQVAKVLLKVVQAVKENKDLSMYDKCDARFLIPALGDILQGKKRTCRAQSARDLMDLNTLLEAFGQKAASLLVTLAVEIQSAASMEEAWNNSQLSIARMSRAYAMLVLLNNAVNGISEAAAGNKKKQIYIGPPEVDVLQDLIRLCALVWMERDMGDFLEMGYLEVEMAGWVRSNVLGLLDKIRPNAVPLVDAFDFSDFLLRSALGRFDGDVYPAIFEASKRDPLNATDPGPGYEPHLRRLVKDGAGIHYTTSRL